MLLFPSHNLPSSSASVINVAANREYPGFIVSTKVKTGTNKHVSGEVPRRTPNSGSKAAWGASQNGE